MITVCMYISPDEGLADRQLAAKLEKSIRDRLVLRPEDKVLIFYRRYVAEDQRQIIAEF